MNNKNDNVPAFLWLFAVLPPILTLLLSFILMQWSWGLMDDLQILSSGSTVLEKAREYFRATNTFGQLRPIWALHSGFLYSVFENNPRAFYIFRLFEICLVLTIWTTASYRITRKRVSLALVPAITLSFHYFYDALFYLSSQE